MNEKIFKNSRIFEDSLIKNFILSFTFTFKIKNQEKF